MTFFIRTRIRKLLIRPPQTRKISKSLQRALAEIEQVTEHKSHRSGNCISDELECPICLASLYFPETDATAEREIDLEDGTNPSLSASKASSATSIFSLAGDIIKKKEPAQTWRPQLVDDDVLKLKRCQHMYHARCLASWFLQNRYDCPVCRTPYYQRVEPAEESPYRQETDWAADYRSAMPVMPFF